MSRGDMCETCGDEQAKKMIGDAEMGAQYFVGDNCYARYEELKQEMRDEKIREAIRAEEAAHE